GDARGPGARGDVALGAGFGEGKVGWTHAPRAVASVQGLDHVGQRPLHVADRQALVDRKTLDLAEVRQPRRLRRVAAVAATRGDDVDRRFLDALHRAYLHRRRMRTQQKLRAEVKGVPVLTRRMAGSDVERLEVVPLGFDLRSELDLVAERLAHGLDLASNLGQARAVD